MKSAIFLQLFTLFLIEVLPVYPIYQGNRVETIADYPYMCGIFRNQTGYGVNVPCGCAIISPSYALTAAHCFHEDDDNPNKAYTFYAGSVNFKEGHRREIFGKKDAIIHPNFTNSNFDEYRVLFHNLAIIKLDPPLEFTDNIKSIRLAIGRNDCEYKEDKKFSIAGWGSNDTFNYGPNKSLILEEQVLYLENLLWGEALPEEEWRNCLMPWAIKGYDEDLHVCSKKHSGVCLGDTGGPWVVRKNDGFDYLCGISLQGLEECSLKESIYLKVSYYKEWICETAKNEPTGCCYIGMKIPDENFEDK